MSLRMSRRNRRLLADKVSFVSRFLSSRSGHDINPEEHMFIEDVSLGVMPLYADRVSGLSIVIDGTQTDIEEASQILASFARHERYSKAELVSDAITEITRRIVWFGEQTAEIVQDSDSSFELYEFTPQRLIQVANWYIQFVPKSEWNRTGKKLVIAHKDKVWRITTPKELGGPKRYRSMIRNLCKFGMPPAFYMEDLEANKTNSHFDLTEYRLQTDVYKSKQTRTWGWTGRDYTLEKWTEYYQLYRLLNFAKAQAILREHIVFELNALFRRLHLAAKIEIEGLNTPSDFTSIQHNLAAGQIGFTEAYASINPERD